MLSTLLYLALHLRPLSALLLLSKPRLLAILLLLSLPSLLSMIALFSTLTHCLPLRLRLPRHPSKRFVSSVLFPDQGNPYVHQDTHIPSQESDIPTFHDDLRFDTAIAQPDSSQDILTTASSIAEPSAYEGQSPSREDLVDHVDDRQAYPGNESADDVECQEDFEAHTVDGGAYNEVHGGDYCAHYDSPAASNDYGDSRHVTEPIEYQSHSSDQEPVVSGNLF